MTRRLCNVCAESIHRQNIITCQCTFTACRSCIRRYVLELVEDSKCMSCNKPYDYGFISTRLGKSWFKGAYRQSREQILFTREMELVPLATQYIEDCTLLLEYERALLHANNECRQFYRAWRCHDVNDNEKTRLRSILMECNARVIELQAQHYTLSSRVCELVITDESMARLYSKCPIESCPGVLDRHRICLTCHAETCSVCFEVLGTAHVCEPTVLDSVQLVQTDTKPCPKCAIPIHKIEGCYQMWCTQCHTTFHYDTLEILNERIHNPHYLEWVHGYDMQRDRTDYQLHRIQYDHFDDPATRTTCLHIARLQIYARYTILVHLQQSLNTVTNIHKKRVRLARYLQGRLTEQKLKKRLFYEYKQKLRYTELQTIWTWFADRSLDLLDTVLNDHDVHKFVEHVVDVVDHVNMQAEHIDAAFHTRTSFRILTMF